ncbi:uncharacterized protein LOC142318833 [Lycorma delicatula]|uniref:uncharacterized protein LOC142318833 n=1 Tax=Lycorma delicatula TaxID=130591 RepID=UPI003F519640
MTNLTTGLFSVIDYIISDNNDTSIEGQRETRVNGSDLLCAGNLCSTLLPTIILTENGSYRGTPTWDVVRTELRWLFLLHAYGFACSFFILAFYAFFSILNIRSLISSRPFMSTINVFLCILGLSRAASLFIDPYHLKNVMPKLLGAVMWDIGYPSIIAGFSLVQLAFLQLTQLKLGPQQLRSKSCLSLIITGHFTCVIGFDIIVGFHSQFKIVKYSLQTLFLLWGFILCCTFIYAGYRVKTLLHHMPTALLQRDFSDVNCKGIMQLAMLAPYNNLATSVAAALVPTLLAPRFAANSTIISGCNDANSNNIQPEASTSTSSTCSIRPKSSMSSRSTTSQRLPDMLSSSRQKSSYSLIPSSSVSPSESPNKSSCDNANSTNISTITNPEPSTPTSCEQPTATQSVRIKKNLSWRSAQHNEQTTTTSGVARDVLNKTKISFKMKKTADPLSDDEDQPTASTSLLPQQTQPVDQAMPLAGAGPDLTLHTILNHIAYVNRAAAHSDSGLAHSAPQATPASRKQQVESVLRVTYATAFTGLLLCLANLFRLYGPYGLHSHSDICPWPWFCFETICRAMELGMGCAMANITKQPTPRQRYMHHPSLHIKHRESLFI